MYAILSAFFLALASSAAAQSSVAALVGSLRDAATEVDRLQLLSEQDVRMQIHNTSTIHMTHIT